MQRRLLIRQLIAQLFPRIAPVALAASLLACQAVPPRQSDEQATSVIYIVKRTWHVDIGFPVTDLQQPLASLGRDFPSARYLEFGFGDRHYLMTRDHGPSTLLAALWPGPGLVLMTALSGTPQQAYGAPNVIALPVTPAQSRHIQSFIWQSLATAKPQDSGSVKPLASGPYDGSVFYGAGSSYSALHTCNTWAAEALQSASLPVHSTGVEFSGQVWSQVKRIAPP
jgi:uncharacterized protein (TIGR02117 family)